MKLGSLVATKLLGPLALVLLAGIGWFLLMSPQTNTLTEVNTEIEAARSQSTSLRHQLRVLQDLQQHLNDTRTTAKALATKFPPTAAQPELFRAVTAAAANAGIPARRLTTLTPTPPVAGSGKSTGAAPLPSAGASATPATDVAAQVVSLSVEGSYEEITLLVQNLERMPRAYLITSLTLSAGATPGTFTATIVGTMFAMPPAQDPALATVAPSDTVKTSP
jgi:Tfp pilus assembly protein PilO